MYIYENHLDGGLYTSDYYLDYEDLYCEQCGDSDNFIGYAETPEEAWGLLEFDTDLFDEDICKSCSHKDDYEYCDFSCEEYRKSGGYDYSYISRFIVESFYIKNPIHVVLLPQHKTKNDIILLHCPLPTLNDLELKREILFMNICLDKKYAKKCASILANDCDYIIHDTIKYIGEREINGSLYIYYSCLTDEPDDIDWKNNGFWNQNRWFEFTKISNIEKNSNSFYEKDILTKGLDLLKKGQINEVYMKKIKGTQF